MVPLCEELHQFTGEVLSYFAFTECRTPYVFDIKVQASLSVVISVPTAFTLAKGS